jgi:7,8-dihydropterin-6-yl-methyl-4-(beta-D-ribofuranosyl)aminobenzene 5'-phosphate synthase
MIGKINISILVENTVGVSRDIKGEWGLSIYIEINNNYHILFDTGADDALLQNARTMKVNLNDVDILILSHGHFDHTGGLRAFLKYLQKPIEVIAHPHLFNERYARTKEKIIYNGIPFKTVELESLGAQFNFIKVPKEISPGVFVSGEVPRIRNLKNDKKLVIFQNQEECPDPLLDDMSLYIVTPSGLVVILGCAHAGIENIIEHGRNITGVKKIHTILGGTHLGTLSDSERDETIDYLKSLNLNLLSANHCTGLAAISKLANIFNKCFLYSSAGKKIELAFN